ncbi:MAG: Fic family protein [Opitutales bacterium]|nr:Fic family protein [Opitutales bacterium]
MTYIYQQEGWPNFTWDKAHLQPLLAKAEFTRGVLLGRMQAIGFNLKGEATLNVLSQEIIKSSEIEGEILNREQVRSSVARRLNIEFKEQTNSSRYVDGVTEMMLDATRNYENPLTRERLFAWHAALFPTGYSGIHKIDVGAFRSDKDGSMQVVSSRRNRETVHFEAPEAAKLEKHVSFFLKWANSAPRDIVSAAIAHLWFVTLHPFDDGNGRITRAITEWMLARTDDSEFRFYGLSSRILSARKEYYAVLEKTQCGGLDITAWIEWFTGTLQKSLEDALRQTEFVFRKSKFWQEHEHIEFSAHQQKVLNRLFDGFEGKLTSAKWAKICKCSQDTASRAIADLITKGILRKEGSGRATHYLLTTE